MSRERKKETSELLRARWRKQIEHDRMTRAQQDRRERLAAQEYFARLQSSAQLDDERRDVAPEKWHEQRWKPSLPIVTLDRETFEKLEPYRP